MSFYRFQRLCVDIGDEGSYSAKLALVEAFVKRWKQDLDLYTFCRLLLCKQDQRVYGLKDKSLTKVWALVLGADASAMEDEMIRGGDAGVTISQWYERLGQPARRSCLTMKQVDAFLDGLTTRKKQDERVKWVEKLVGKGLTVDDVKWICKLIRKDLWINIGPKYVLPALHPKAFEAYKRFNDLRLLIDKIEAHLLDQELDEALEEKGGGASPRRLQKTLSTGMRVGTAIKPQLARASKSFADAVKRCPNGMRCEIKYDGERIQMHRSADGTLTCFSRNLKPVMPWKVEHVKEHIGRAMVAQGDVVLDGEILLKDKHGNPLPFGTLGKHKKANFSDATVCIFMFDILYLGGRTLLDVPFDERRHLLEQNVRVIPNRIELSELHRPRNEDELAVLMTRCIRTGLEGLVIKDGRGPYKPAARHWLKMKKDYLSAGSLADSADLVVLGAYYGSGNKGGLLTTLLMGAYDAASGTWKTVCKCGNGFDDATLASMQPTLLRLMSKCGSYERVPKCMHVSRTLVPDYVARDVRQCPVYEIAGAEFSDSTTHTADGISIRFPRVVRLRDDKDWNSATTLDELRVLAKASMDNITLTAAGGVVRALPSPKPSSSASASPSRKRTSTDTANGDVGGGGDNASASPSRRPRKKQARAAIHSGDDDDDNDDNDGHDDDDDDDQSDTVMGLAPPDTSQCGQVNHVVGDLVHPLVGGSRVIAHIADDSGSWSRRGVFRAISNRWPEPRSLFEAQPGALGDVQVVKVDTDASGRVYVATLIVQRSSDHAVEESALEQALVTLVGIVKHKQASLHLPHLARQCPGLETLLTKYFVARSIAVFVYRRGSPARAPQGSASGARPKAQAATKKPPPHQQPKSVAAPAIMDASSGDDDDDGDGDGAAGGAGVGVAVARGAQPSNGAVPTASSGPAGVLPSIFNGVTMWIDGSVQRAAQLTRWVIAWDGNVVPKVRPSVTHLVTQEALSADVMARAQHARVVSAQWVWDSISAKKRLPEGDFTV